jgi:hypothetical protein
MYIERKICATHESQFSRRCASRRFLSARIPRTAQTKNKKKKKKTNKPKTIFSLLAPLLFFIFFYFLFFNFRSPQERRLTTLRPPQRLPTLV